MSLVDSLNMDAARMLAALALASLASCQQLTLAPPSPKPYCRVDQPCFPPDGSWTLNRLNGTLQGSLRRTTPVPRVCYDGELYNQCVVF